MYISKDILRICLTHWEMDRRAGNCLPPKESAALTLEEYADRAVDVLWDDLVKETHKFDK